jgi:putative aldouronate transport system permease protein
MARKQARFWMRRISPGDVVIYLILCILFVIMFYPFFYVLFLSVMPYRNFVQQSVHIWPSGFTLAYFREVLRQPGLANGFQISVLKTLIGAGLSVVVTTMAGYALSRRRLLMGRFLSFLFLIPMFFHGGIIPYFLTVRATGLLYTFAALIVPFLVLPLWLFVTRSYYIDYPEEIIESAVIDGAGELRIFRSIIWPTSTPLIATLAMMYGTFHWNEYFWSRILTKPDLWPATAHLYNIIQTRAMLEGLGTSAQLTQHSFIAAVAAMLIVPVLLVYPLLQRFVIKGIMVGAIKG